MAKKVEMEDKKAALELAITEITKNQGEGSIIRGTKRVKCEVISTGASVLDVNLGIGGIPRGRITEIYGPESSGKTTLALTVAANAQKMGGTVAYIDAEHALDPTYASAIGVDMDAILISQPDSGEQALEIADRLVQSGAVDLIVIDSVAALVPKSELEGNMGDAHVGAQARLMSQGLRKLKGAINRTNTAMIFINQLREKIGIMFGNPETTSGGRALKFYASVRIDIRSSKLPTGNGNLATTKIVKNKLAPPFKTAQFEIIYGKGINRAGCAIDLAVDYKLLEKRGSHFYYNQLKLGNGKEAASKTLEENEDILLEIEKLVAEKFEKIKNMDANPTSTSAPVSSFNDDEEDDDVPVGVSEGEDNQEE